MNSLLSDNDIVNNDVPNNCKALIHYGNEVHAITTSTITNADSTALITPTNWLPVCHKYSAYCESAAGLNFPVITEL